ADLSLGGAPTSAVANSISISNGATLQITANTITIAANRGVTLGSGGGVIETLTGNTDTIAGIIVGTSLTKNNLGTLVLGNAGNTYSGGTIINTGTIQVSNLAALGNVAGGLTFNGGTLQ